MDEFENMALISDDFGIEPVHIAASVGAAGVLWYGHHKKWWHHLWPFGHKHHGGHEHGAPRAMVAPGGAAIEDMPAPDMPQKMPYLDELMSVESMGGFYTPEPPAPVVDESSVVVEETVETTDETLFVESMVPRRPEPPRGHFVVRPAPPIPRGRPAPPIRPPVR